eukprot:2606226-Alexandrium_andersonii.AAC.1
MPRRCLRGCDSPTDIPNAQSPACAEGRELEHRGARARAARRRCNSVSVGAPAAPLWPTRP